MRWNVQWWAALATVLAGLMSIPALVISMNALRVADEQRIDARRLAEQQRVDARRQKSEDDHAAARAFARRVKTSDDVEEWFMKGGDLFVDNGTTVPVEMELLLSWKVERKPDEHRKVRLSAPACSRAMYRLTAGTLEEAGTEGVDFGEEYPQATSVVLNPHDDRWWYTPSRFEEPAPVTQEHLDILDRLGMSVFTPDRRTPLTGCV